MLRLIAQILQIGGSIRGCLTIFATKTKSQIEIAGIFKKFLLSFAFLLLLAIQGYSSESFTCSSIFKSDSSIAKVKRLLAKHLNPEKGNGLVKFSVSRYFSPKYIEELYKKIPKIGSFELVLNGVDVFQNSSTRERELFGYPDPEVVAPIYKYANEILNYLNESLPEPERGNLRIELIRIAISNGNQTQVNETWHRDMQRYMTLIANLKGAGTLYMDPSGIAGSDSELAPGEAMVMNGYGRYFMFPGSGSMPILHRAPEGSEHLRLGIVVFFRLMDVPGPQMIEMAQMTEPDSPSRQSYIQKILNRLRGIDRSDR